MATVAAIAAIVASIVGTRTLLAGSVHRAAPVAFVVSGVLLFVEWLALGYNAHIAACVISLHIVAYGAVLLSSFWSLTNESFDPCSAKAAQSSAAAKQPPSQHYCHIQTAPN